MRSWLEVALDLERRAVDFVTITLTASRGHAPQDPGAKALVTAEGLVFGTVGGGKVEARAIREAQALLATPETSQGPVTHTWNLQRDIGMTCGGEVTYLFECHRHHHWRIRIFGAGHVAQALVRALAPLPTSLTCVDPRAEWTSRLPSEQSNLQVVQTDDPAGWVEKNLSSPDEFFVVLTQGHASDVPVLEALFRKFPVPRYIGVIGSETKGLRIRHELRERGVPEESLATLRVPVGLPIGGNHPAEIAISIAAELLQVRAEGQ